MLDLQRIKAIGFDLDGTLYPTTSQINNRIRDEMARRILDKKPDLMTLNEARTYFELRYAQLKSGSKVLAEAGYEDANRERDSCLASADVSDLIVTDETLQNTLNKISSNYTTSLLTSSPRDYSFKKLDALGVEPSVFKFQFYSDYPKTITKTNGQAHSEIVQIIEIPAERHLFIGDNADADIIPAKRLGMQTIAVGKNIPEADLWIPNIHGIEALFK